MLLAPVAHRFSRIQTFFKQWSLIADSSACASHVEFLSTAVMANVSYGEVSGNRGVVAGAMSGGSVIGSVSSPTYEASLIRLR